MAEAKPTPSVSQPHTEPKPVVGIQLPFCPKSVSDVLLWRDPKKSALYFLIHSSAFGYLQYSPSGPIVLILTLLAYASASAFTAGQFGAVLGRQPVPIPAIFKEGISEEQAKNIALKLRDPINKVFAALALLMSGKDLQLSATVAVLSWTGAWLFKRIRFHILVYTFTLLSFIAPKIYELKKEEIDKVLVKVDAKIKELIKKFNEQVSPLLAKLPKTVPPPKEQPGAPKPAVPAAAGVAAAVPPVPAAAVPVKEGPKVE